MPAFVNALITVVAGSAATVAMVVIAYYVSYVADRMSCFQSALLTEEELEARRNASDVTIKAGLAGLLSDERERVFRTFFETQSFPYHKGLETTVAKVDKVIKIVDLEAQTEHDKDGDGNQANSTIDRQISDMGDDTPAINDDPLNVVQDAETAGEDRNEPTCSICLNAYGEYGEGSVVD
jgi:hypothetical protein